MDFAIVTSNRELTKFLRKCVRLPESTPWILPKDLSSSKIKGKIVIGELPDKWHNLPKGIIVLKGEAYENLNFKKCTWIEIMATNPVFLTKKGKVELKPNFEGFKEFFEQEVYHEQPENSI